MRKTLLIAASALAASVISSQAGVYSQNIVGYVNSPVPTGFVNMSVPLDSFDPGTGLINNAITNTLSILNGTFDGSPLYVFNGVGYTIYTCDSSWPTGIGDPSDSHAVAPPVLNPGVAWFIDNTTGVATNAFTGQVHVEALATGSQTVGTTTNHIPVGQLFYGSKLPVGGGLGSILQLPVLTGQLDGSIIYVPVITGGAVHGFTIYTCDSGMLPSGFADPGDSHEVAEPVIPIGTGFMLNNTTGATDWVQSY